MFTTWTKVGLVRGWGRDGATYERVVDVLDPAPLSVWRQDLQGGDGLAVEDGDGSGI